MSFEGSQGALLVEEPADDTDVIEARVEDTEDELDKVPKRKRKRAETRSIQREEGSEAEQIKKERRAAAAARKLERQAESVEQMLREQVELNSKIGAATKAGDAKGVDQIKARLTHLEKQIEKLPDEAVEMGLVKFRAAKVAEAELKAKAEQADAIARSERAARVEKTLKSVEKKLQRQKQEPELQAAAQEEPAVGEKKHTLDEIMTARRSKRGAAKATPQIVKPEAVIEKKPIVEATSPETPVISEPTVEETPEPAKPFKFPDALKTADIERLPDREALRTIVLMAEHDAKLTEGRKENTPEALPYTPVPENQQIERVIKPEPEPDTDFGFATLQDLSDELKDVDSLRVLNSNMEARDVAWGELNRMKREAILKGNMVAVEKIRAAIAEQDAARAIISRRMDQVLAEQKIAQNQEADARRYQLEGASMDRRDARARAQAEKVENVSEKPQAQVQPPSDAERISYLRKSLNDPSAEGRIDELTQRSTWLKDFAERIGNHPEAIDQSQINLALSYIEKFKQAESPELTNKARENNQKIDALVASLRKTMPESKEGSELYQKTARGFAEYYQRLARREDVRDMDMGISREERIEWTSPKKPLLSRIGSKVSGWFSKSKSRVAEEIEIVKRRISK